MVLVCRSEFQTLAISVCAREIMILGERWPLESLQRSTNMQVVLWAFGILQQCKITKLIATALRHGV